MTYHFGLAKQLLICIIVYMESFSLIGAPKYFSLVTLQYGSLSFILVTLQYEQISP
jgi:hypothetical protein